MGRRENQTCARCAAVLWGGDGHCVRCGYTPGVEVAPAPLAAPIRQAEQADPISATVQEEGSAEISEKKWITHPAPFPETIPVTRPAQLSEPVQSDQAMADPVTESIAGPVAGPTPEPVPAEAPVPSPAPVDLWGGAALLAPSAPEARSSGARSGQHTGVVAVAAMLLVAVVVASTVLWRSGALGGDDPGPGVDARGVSAVTTGEGDDSPSPSAEASRSDSPDSPEDELDPMEDPSDGEMTGSSSSELTSALLASTGASLTSDAFARAPSTSSDAVDGYGNATSYDAINMLDGNPETTWRMEGDGAGQTLTFTLDEPTTISRLGLVNGYDKFDPKSAEDRYEQSRRITAVTWRIGNKTFRQRLDDGDRSMQLINMGPLQGQRITLEIDATTDPGSSSFNQTAISEVEILG